MNPKAALGAPEVLLAGVLVALPPLVAGALPGDDATRCARLVWAYGLAGLPYLVVWRRWRGLHATSNTLWALLASAALARLVLLWVPPLLSEDVWRYVWDGVVQGHGLNPYRYAPFDPALDGLASEPGLAALRARIGHGELPTIYPPAAQAVFAALAWLRPTVGGFRLAMVGFDLLAVLGLWRWAERSGRPPGLAALYAFAPLAVVESAIGGHVDALGVAATVAAGALLAGAAPIRAGLAVAVGVGTKLLPVLVLPTLLWRGPRRAVWACLAACGALGAAYLGRGNALAGGLSAYGHRWRGNEGAFALIAWPFEHALAPLDRAADVPGWVVTLTRTLVGPGGSARPDEVWGDEVAFAAAKAVVVGALACFGLWRFLRARDFESLLGPVVAAILVLSPIVHPWYLMWVLPFAALAEAGSSRWGAPFLAWALTAWLAYLPRAGWLSTGVWLEQPAARALEYAPLGLGLAIIVFRAVQPAAGRRAGGAAPEE